MTNNPLFLSFSDFTSFYILPGLLFLKIIRHISKFRSLALGISETLSSDSFLSDSHFLQILNTSASLGITSVPHSPYTFLTCLTLFFFLHSIYHLPTSYNIYLFIVSLLSFSLPLSSTKVGVILFCYCFVPIYSQHQALS